jgi:putative inorganic carbon (HCO3(-)) transporter
MDRVPLGIGRWLQRDEVSVGLLALVAVGFYVFPWPPAYGLCFLILAGLTFLRLQLALAIVPGFAPFVMEPKYIGHLTFAPTEILVGLDVLVAFLLIAFRRSPAPNWQKLRASSFLAPACVFVVAITISTAIAPDRHLALHAFRERVVDPLAYFALLLLFVRTRAEWYWILGGILAGGLAAGAIGLGQFALQRDLSTVSGTGIRRVEALYGSPDNLGLLLDRIVPIWLVLALALDRRIQFRLALWASGVFLVIPLILTYSVGAWIAIGIVVSGVAALLRPWGKWVVLGVAVVAAGAVGVKYRSVQHAFQSGHANSTQARIDVWRSSLQMIRHRPIVGIGPDNFQRLYAPTRAENKYQRECVPGQGYIQPGAGAEPCLSHPHDEFLDFWLSSGILGLISYVWLLYVFWRAGFQTWRRSSGASTRTLVLAVMSAMLAGMIHGLIDNSYFLVDLSLLFWLFCAVVSWLDDEPEPSTDTGKFSHAAGAHHHTYAVRTSAVGK